MKCQGERVRPGEESPGYGPLTRNRPERSQTQNLILSFRVHRGGHRRVSRAPRKCRWFSFARTGLAPRPRTIRRLTLLFQESNEFRDVVVANTQIGHSHLLIFLKQGRSDRVTVLNHLVRRLDKMFQPFGITNLSDTLKIRSNLVAVTYGMAGRAICGENI